MSDAPPLFILAMLEREPSANVLLGTWHAVSNLARANDDDKLFRRWAIIAGVPIPEAFRVGGMLIDLGLCDRNADHPDAKAERVASAAVASRLVRRRIRPRPPARP